MKEGREQSLKAEEFDVKCYVSMGLKPINEKRSCLNWQLRFVR